MTLFQLVFFKVLSSLLSVLIGYLSGKFSKVQKESITSLLFYFVAPIVFFAIPTSTKLEFSDLGITLISFTLCTCMGFFAFWFYGKFWQDSHKNIIALSAGTGNSGYVVLPIATVIFDDYTLSIYALGLIGVALYESSVGCYFCARSAHSLRHSMFKVARLPLLNAFFLGCIFSILGFQLPDFLNEFVGNMKGAFSILGMVTIGLALSYIHEFNLDLKFIAATFFNKFILFPLTFFIFITLDRFVFGLYNENYYNALQILSMAPMATNTIVIASLYNIYPEKMATAVLLSLLFSLIYMPVMAMFCLSDIA